MRTGMGTPARIRHQAGGGFYRAPEKKNQRSSAHSYSAPRRLYHPRACKLGYQSAMGRTREPDSVSGQLPAKNPQSNNGVTIPIRRAASITTILPTSKQSSNL